METDIELENESDPDQAMEINEINADTIMEFWLFYGFIAFMLWLCCLDYINQMNKIAWDSLV